MKTPVIAVIEYNYERDGEIVIPAGTKAIGQLAQANQNGQVGFDLRRSKCPTAVPRVLKAVASVSTTVPLKGTVNGRNGQSAPWFGR